ncbi:MAG: cytochrome c3 family protein [Desulfobulbales bacterium]|nr:cytochrome c3 family protein [Desulfobulbales bacterium]
MFHLVGRLGIGKIAWAGRALGFYGLAVAAVLTSLAAPADAGEISLLAPFANKQLIMSRNKIVNLVVKVADPQDLDNLYLQSAGGDRAYDPTGRYEKEGVYYVHYSVHLKKGNNDFIVGPAELAVKIRYTPLSSLLHLNFDDPELYLFHKNEVIPAECRGCHGAELPPRLARPDPLGYGQVSTQCYSCHQRIVEGPEWKHSPASAMLCRACHQAAPPRAEVAVPTGKIEDICFGCHLNKKKWLAMKHVHGPVGTGDCTICHDPHGSNSQFQLWTDGKAKLCVVCHEDKKKFIARGAEEKLNVHAILSARGCVVCHSPHATEHRFQLLDEIEPLCISCHAALRGVDQGHPVVGHPLRGVGDPLRAGTALVCTSCHDPHGSGYVFMLPADVRGGLVCAKCHSGGIREKPKRPAWMGG